MIVLYERQLPSAIDQYSRLSQFHDDLWGDKVTVLARFCILNNFDTFLSNALELASQPDNFCAEQHLNRAKTKAPGAVTNRMPQV